VVGCDGEDALKGYGITESEAKYHSTGIAFCGCGELVEHVGEV
jgi:hypothetical protein